MHERWVCGAYECGVVVTGEQGKLDHLRAGHSDLYGLLYVPYEGPDMITGPPGEDTDGPGE